MMTKTAKSENKKLTIDSKSINFLSRLSILLLLGVALSILSPYFLTPINLINVAAMGSIPIILALGQTVVILTGQIDLSLGSIFSIGGVVSAAFMEFLSVPVPIAIVAGILTGTLMGFFNGVLFSKAKLPSFIATYGLSLAITGFSNGILKGYIVYGFPDSFRFLGVDRILNIPVPIYFAVISIILLGVLLKRSVLGRKIFAVGANPEAAKLSGINNDRVFILVYMISGTFAALAGILQVARVNSSHAFMGDTMLLPAIAAVVIGGTSMFGGVGSAIGTVIGALIMRLIQNGLNLLGAPSIWQQFIVGVIILIAVLIDQSVRNLTAKRVR
jgi:ribose transport system permease protein